jgi:hypothetical protein
MARKAIEDRFWAHVNKRDDGCWVWTGAARSGGYGVFHDGERSRAAHRFSWELAYGALPEAPDGNANEGFSVAHVCGNRRCVRPEHLHLVSSTDRARGKRRITMLPFDTAVTRDTATSAKPATAISPESAVPMPGATPGVGDVAEDPRKPQVRLLESMFAFQEKIQHGLLNMARLDDQIAWVHARIRVYRAECERFDQGIAQISQRNHHPVPSNGYVNSRSRGTTLTRFQLGPAELEASPATES